MSKRLVGWMAAGCLALAAPAGAMAAPASVSLNPSALADSKAVMKLPRCTKERTTQCMVVKNGTWIAVGVLGLAALTAIAAGGGGGKSASP